MLRDAKQNLLDAFDALGRVASGDVPRPTHNTHGGSAACALCHHSLASGTANPCPIGVAQRALGALLPPYEQREVWLADDSLPAWVAT